VQWGVLAEEGTMDHFANNTFHIPDADNGVYPKPYGMCFYGYHGFFAIGNTFGSLAANNHNKGLVAQGYAYGKSAGRVTDNTFSGLNSGLQTELTTPGIFVDCNSFTGQARDWNLFPDEPFTDPDEWQLFPSQGTGCDPGQIRRGNKFLDRTAPKRHIWSESKNDWTYYCRPVENETPRICVFLWIREQMYDVVLILICQILVKY
jgi:hypothetical protein